MAYLHHQVISKAKLRTKSGCLTCRKRKVKCGEERNLCDNCVVANRPCEWPTQDSLLDGRNRRRSGQRRLITIPPANYIGADGEHERLEVQDCQLMNVKHNADPPAWAVPLLSPLCLSLSSQSTIKSDMDNELLIHYQDSLYVMMLSTAHRGFFEDYRTHVTTIGLSNEGVKNAVLAWSAGNKFVRNHDPRYRQAALSYYSRAVSAVKMGIARLEQMGKRRLDDVMLTMVEYLYLHSLWGPDTGVDTRKHVAGAMSLLNLRYGDMKDMVRPFDRVSVESVLYQAFLMHMRFPFSPNFHVSDDFVRQTELLLNYLGFEDVSVAENTPVLGLPLELYRLILDIITHFGSVTQERIFPLSQLGDRMTYWERQLDAVHDFEDDSILNGNPHRWVIELYILATSLMMSLMSWYHPTDTRPRQSSSRPSREYWQVRRVLELFEDDSIYETWTRCYIVLWPMLIVGYAAQDGDEVAFVDRILDDMCQRMGYGEVRRVHEELKTVWSDMV